VKILYLVGQSAVGKKTLITRLMDPIETALRGKFGITGDMVAVGPSFDKINHKIWNLKADVVLYQWQYCNHTWVLPMYEFYKDADQKVVLLVREFDQHFADLCKRGRGWPTRPEQWKDDWDKKFIPNLRGLHKAGLEIEIRNGNYDIIEFKEPLTGSEWWERVASSESPPE
jgi:hypothetical protein